VLSYPNTDQYNSAIEVYVSIEYVKLKLTGPHQYALFSASGAQLSEVFRGSEDKAIRWAKAFCSSWVNWVVDTEELKDEKKS